VINASGLAKARVTQRRALKERELQESRVAQLYGRSSPSLAYQTGNDDQDPQHVDDDLRDEIDDSAPGEPHVIPDNLDEMVEEILQRAREAEATGEPRVTKVSRGKRGGWLDTPLS
jgi:hypothetical protein